MVDLNCTFNDVYNNASLVVPCLENAVTKASSYLPSLSNVFPALNKIAPVLASTQANPGLTIVAMVLSSLGALACTRKVLQKESEGTIEGFFRQTENIVDETTGEPKTKVEDTGLAKFIFKVPAPSKAAKLGYATAAVVLSGVSLFLNYALFSPDCV